MPLTVNVGLSRKASENYQSKGLSINITAELDQSLLADPPRLQDEIDRIYSHAEDALERQSASGQQRLPGSQPGRLQAPPANGSLNGSSGHTNGHAAARNASPAGNGTAGPRFPRPTTRQAPAAAEASGIPFGGPIRPATESQMRALRSLAKRLDCELGDLVSEAFGDSSSYLDIRQASHLIDVLKARLGEVPTPGNGQASNGRERSRA